MILWASGGIGIRARLKIAFLRDCGFKSHLAHHRRLHAGQLANAQISVNFLPVTVRRRPVQPYIIEKLSIKLYNKLDFSRAYLLELLELHF
jgi:hypothetical protein